MPIYDFECENCGGKLEFLCKVENRDNPRKCPKCSGMMWKQEVQKVDFQLKGTGWYSDGYDVGREKSAFED